MIRWSQIEQPLCHPVRANRQGFEISGTRRLEDFCRAVVHEGEPRLGMLQGVRDRLPPGGKVDLGGPEPTVEGTIEGGQPVAPVGMEDRNALALFGTFGHEQTRNTQGLVAHPPPRQAAPVIRKDEGGAIGARAMVQPVANRALWRLTRVGDHCEDAFQ